MINGKYHAIYKDENGENIIIDIAKIYDDYEVMVMTEDGDEIEVETVDNLDIAIRIFNSYCEEFGAAPLTGKYKKLKEDLIKAVAAGEVAITLDPEDGGTCNLDAATIKLPRWNRKKVEQAAREAGTGAWLWELWGSRSYVLTARGGQANARTRYAEAMRDSLKAAGYEAGMYYAMD